MLKNRKKDKIKYYQIPYGEEEYRVKDWRDRYTAYFSAKKSSKEQLFLRKFFKDLL